MMRKAVRLNISRNTTAFSKLVKTCGIAFGRKNMQRKPIMLNIARDAVSAVLHISLIRFISFLNSLYLSVPFFSIFTSFLHNFLKFFQKGE